MKKLLVLTDFSANAAHAEAAALRLSACLSADILLYHAFTYIPMVLGNMEGPLITADMLFQDSLEQLKKEAHRLNKLGAQIEGCQTHIDCKTGDGSLAENVRDLTLHEDIHMVVMGGRSGGALDHLLTGSDTAAVIRRSHKPVWVIPVAADWDLPKKVVFATDFSLIDMPAVDFLLDLAKNLHFELEIVHVLRSGEVVTEIGPEIAFRKFLVHRGLTYIQVFGEAVHLALQQYCTEHQADLLALSHQHHSFLSSLFGHSESKAAIAQRRLAVIVFPPDYN